MSRPGRSRARRLATVAAAVVAIAVGSACGAGHRTDSAGSHGAASITIDHDRRALHVTSCTSQADAIHVVAQAAGGWTLDVRQDGTAHNAMLVLVHNASTGVQSYQASANVLHPHGNPPSRIKISRDGKQLSGSATLLRSSSAAGGKSGAKRSGRPATTAATFHVTCTG